MYPNTLLYACESQPSLTEASAKIVTVTLAAARVGRAWLHVTTISKSLIQSPGILTTHAKRSTCRPMTAGERSNIKSVSEGAQTEQHNS